MADPTERGTFGIEFEFFPTAIAQWRAADIPAYANTYTYLGSKINGSESAEALGQLYPGALVVPREFLGNKGVYIINNIIRLLRERGVHTNDIDNLCEPILPQDSAIISQGTPFNANSTRDIYHRWSVTEDGSVESSSTYNPAQQKQRDSYLEAEMKSCNGIELISPALTDTPQSFQEVMKVFTIVKSLNFMHVNDTCGLHVHVAFGKHGITMVPLRKIASLLFALDPFLAALRPDSRSGNNEHCQSIRKFSNAARGHKLADAIKGLKNPGKSIIDPKEPDYFDPQPKPNVVDWVPIPDAVEAIKSCKKPEEVAWLLTTQGRANYDFKKFLEGTINPTIEFREHEATLDTPEVVAWSRFCVRVVRYAALNMTDDELNEIVMICHDVEENPSPDRFALWELFKIMKLEDEAVDLRVPRPKPSNRA
ncbi:uncharacterized protein PG986_001184 [Apiospora aurea]|uniref:Amidoligase enzyme n=1 Tax=Apiospora aurea TaxID=335848 RepID=A0ABR1QW34_9PEZI